MNDAATPPAEGGLLSHLLELRARLLKACAALALAFVALLPFANALYTQLARPLLRYLPAGAHLQSTDVTGPFLVPFRLVFLVALLAAMPVVIYQLWAFVAPGLYKHEKRLARPLLLVATVLFYLGCAFTYFVLLPAMFSFLAGTTPAGVELVPDIGRYLDFVSVMFLAGGIAFEVPVAVAVSVLLGWVTPAQLSEWRGYVLIAIFVIAAILTPPDAVSQVLLALPMWALYEIGLLWARLLVRPAKATTA
jgi:sec-independent protein translocase protein TatC